MYSRYFANKFKDVDVGVVEINAESMKRKCLQLKDLCVSKFARNEENCDGGLYVGLGGLAYALWYASTKSAFDENQRRNLLHEAKSVLGVHLNFVQRKRIHEKEKIAFLLGNAGLNVAASLLFKTGEEHDKAKEYVHKFAEGSQYARRWDKTTFGEEELFVGRAGYLCGLLNLRLKLKAEIVDDQTVKDIIQVLYESGRTYSTKHRSPSFLMYSYYRTEYLGAAHGLCTILQMMLSFPDVLRTCAPEVEAGVRKSVDWLLSIQMENGNTPPTTEDLGTDIRDEDELVHWCHGAPGNVYMYCRAFLTWKDEKYLRAALKCGDVVWQKGLLKKGPGICHGIAGNAYVFLSLYRLTQNPLHLHRALKFAEFMDDPLFLSQARTPDSPYSLFEGWAGAICLFADLAQDPNQAEFPLFPVFF